MNKAESIQEARDPLEKSIKKTKRKRRESDKREKQFLEDEESVERMTTKGDGDFLDGE